MGEICLPSLCGATACRRAQWHKFGTLTWKMPACAVMNGRRMNRMMPRMFCVVGTNTPWPRNPKTMWAGVSTRIRRRENQTPQQSVGEAAAYHERVQERLAFAFLTSLRIVQQLSPARTPCSARSRFDGVHSPERAQVTPPRDVDVCMPRAVHFAGGEALSDEN